MLPPQEHFLGDFGISQRTGFLPDKLPLRNLPDSYFRPWEIIVEDLPELIQTRTLREAISRLPVLTTEKLFSIREWQRAYVLLCFLAHGYIWGGETPAEILPPAITRPFLKVSAHLGLPPTATYAALNLWNFTPLSPDDDLCQPDNLVSLHTFTGTSDESWFFAISVAMEARGGAIIPVMMRALAAAKADDSQIVSESLVALANCLRELGALLERMYEKCDPNVFYHEIRPMLAGSKNMAVAGLPRGVFYDDGEGTGQWRQYSGGSNAQSSLIQFFDIILGVEHRATGGTTVSKKNGFMQEMRNYMPSSHTMFLDHVSPSTIRNYVLSYDSAHPLVEDYNSAVAMLTAFRDKHIQIVTRYIMLPSKSPIPCRNKPRGFNLAVASTLRVLKDSKASALQGTGGTQLIPFLKQTRDETKQVSI